jgi:hypothetical protein
VFKPSATSWSRRINNQWDTAGIKDTSGYGTVTSHCELAAFAPSDHDNSCLLHSLRSRCLMKCVHLTHRPTRCHIGALTVSVHPLPVDRDIISWPDGMHIVAWHLPLAISGKDPTSTFPFPSHFLILS